MSTWSTPQLDHEAVGALVWPTATVWRANPGFAGQSYPGGVHTFGSPRPPHPVAGLISEWLARAEPGLRLRLLLALGESVETSAAWIGLTAGAATHAAAVARLEAPAEALAEALDAWSLFRTCPEAPPALPEPCHHFHVLPGPAPVLANPNVGHPLAVMSHFSRLRRPLVLDLTLAPRGVEASVLNEIEATQAQIQAALSIDPASAYSPNEDDAELSRIESRALRLLDAALGMRFSACLWGKPPGEVLLPRLMSSVSRLLNAPIALLEEAPAAPHPLEFGFVGQILGALRAGSGRADAAVPEGEDDEPSMDDEDLSVRLIRF